jgi:hypothetical protein
MVSKQFLFAFLFFISGKLLSQSYIPVVIKSTPNSYTVPVGYNLKIESVGYSCDMQEHTDQILIDGQVVKLRQHIKNESGSTNSQSQSVWEIHLPIWLPSGSIIGLNNHSSIQIFGLLIPVP